MNPAAPPGAGFAPSGTAIPDYKWLINKDDVGNPGTALNQVRMNPTPRVGVADSVWTAQRLSAETQVTTLG